jgi:hypothetical protein
VLEALAALARRRGVLVAAAALVVVAVIGPALLGRGDRPPDAADVTSTSASTTEPLVTSPATTVAPTSSVEVPEADHPGEPADTARYAGEVVAGAPPGDPRRANDHDRELGGTEPARISGFSAWALSADAPTEAPAGTPADPGPWLRVQVRVLNRDDAPQPYTFTDWTLVGPDGVALQATFASQDFKEGRTLPANAQAEGELWFRTAVQGRHWLLYRPQHDRDRGVWAVDVPPA